ncbi:Ig-like domain-containing protein [Anaerovorax odorimutans]|uniref:Ig-like domain-containing protein n=1 Tax=Anaerovorax odorimutans TaxID=109327 RepID=A0ABT1RJG6_9FIRM|nr:Ig-like domain-containing protein [Anaerovorax odorimutans]MCQ4635331.1 Ig-like domain-containing protein [Anaerovorax odorimutans]
MKKQGKTKKLLAFLLSLTVLFTMSAPAVWAETSDDPTVTGTVDKVNLSIQSGNARVSAVVRDDYSAYLQITKNATVDAANATIKLTMKNIESLGMGNMEKSHEISINTGVTGHDSVPLEGFIEPITNFKDAKISGKIDGKEYSYKIENKTQPDDSDYLIKASTNTEQTRAAWQSLASHVTTTTYAEDDSYMMIPAKAYMQIGKERLSFTDPDGTPLKLDDTSNLDQMQKDIRNLVELDTNAPAFSDSRQAEAYIPAGTILRVGATEARLMQGATIDLSGLNTETLADDTLSGLRDAGNNSDMIKALITFVMNPISAASGQQDIKCNISFDKVDVEKTDETTTVNVDKPDPMESTTVDTIKNILATAGAEETVEVVVPQTKDGEAPEIDKAIFAAAKDSQAKTLVIKTKDEENAITATFVFNTEEIANDIAVNPGIKASVKDDSQKLADAALPAGTKTMGITLAHNGDFPAPANITLSVDKNKFKAGDTVYLYYINPNTKKLEQIGDKPLTVSDEYTVTFTLAHASEYVITSAAVKNAVDVSGITLNTTKTSVKTGKTVALKATITPADATNKTVTWTSSNTKVATVDANGVVTGRAVGSATITAKTANGKTAACAVSVSLSAPENVKAASASNTSVKVSWQKAVGAQKYQVYRATSKKGKFKKVATTSGASYTNKKLTTGKTYYYKVKAIAGSSTSAYTKVVSAKPVPKAPTKVKAKKASKTSIKVSWKKVSKANGYKVYRATSQKGKYKAVKTITKGSTTKYTNKKLKKNKTYYYKVRAYQKVKGKKVYGTYSKVVKARTK